MCQQSVNMPIEGYYELMWKQHQLDEIINLVIDYQYEERTNPGPEYTHISRVKALVHDLEFLLRKDCGPTLEECPYAE